MVAGRLARRISGRLLVGCGGLFWMAVCGAAAAQDPAGVVAAEAESVRPGDINLTYSRVYIFVDKAGRIGHQHAVEGKLKSGQLHLSAAPGSALVFDMQSFDADTANARKFLRLEGETDDATRQQVNANMLGEEILDVGRYPEAKLENITLQATGKLSKRELPEYAIEGDFTLQAKTRRVRILCDVEPKNGWQHVRGGFRILQSDYGIRPYSRMLGAVGVKDELLIVGDLWVAPAP
jgi:hypothetical protein